MKHYNRRHQYQIIKDDPWLEPAELDIILRHNRYQFFLDTIEQYWGSLYDFANGHHFFGINYDSSLKGWQYREWAPAAKALFLVGDFNQWNQTSHPLKPTGLGSWEIFIDETKEKIPHESKLMVLVHAANGSLLRIPAYIRRAVQDEKTKGFTAQHWQPEEVFDWENDSYDTGSISELLIYEAHTGMAQEKEGVGTYREFADLVLPRIKQGGYNAVQLMAVQEHPYYGSFGYHVSNFFAPSSRFGTPEDLKYLVKKAHQMEIAVIMDIVHSHAVKNILEGLNMFDGSESQYFHAGWRGEHPDWDSKVFNYGNWEVIRFLLSNVRYWLEEFHFDGFRFDGVTSMLYVHHGRVAFDSRDKYFTDSIDHDAITYLQLANKLIHDIKPKAISIAEDVSGMPGLCRPAEDGGIGFDYRLGMGIPDYWIKLMKERSDEFWNVDELWHVMNDRLPNVGTIAYAESHDQAMVGDKTLAFWLMDKEMYFSMSKHIESLAVDRGIALHKMIRLFTISLGGNAYLNFMGNEFGHPEWIDFPREGNGWSHKHARRQWSLRDNGLLLYHCLADFDEEMINLIRNYKILSSSFGQKLHSDLANQTIVFERNDLIFLFNFSPTKSVSDYKFYVPKAGKYQIILNTDNAKFGGFDRVDESMEFFSLYNEEHDFHYLQIYNINRSAMVLRCVEEGKTEKKKTAKKAK